MAIQPMALQVQNPQINAVQDFQTGQANALNAKAGEMNQEAAALQQLAEAGYGVLDHNLDGPINQQRLDQMLGLMGANPLVAKIKANPELIRTITKGSLAILAVQNDQAKAALEKQKLERELNAPPAAPTPTDDQREYSQAVEQGYKGTFMDYMGEIKKAGAAQTTITMPGETNGGTSVAQFQKDLGGLNAKKYDSINTDAQSAQSNLGTLALMEDAIQDPGFYSGIGVDQVLQLKRIASALGMNPEGIASMESFDSLNKQASLEAMGGSLGTGFSNADRDFVTEQVPSPNITREGNLRIIAIRRAIAERKILYGDMATQYVEKNGVLDAGFFKQIAEYGKQNPVFANLTKDGGGDGSQNGDPTEFVTPNGITYSY